MSDFYITNLNGVFTTTTETEAVGVSLFDIWDGYRMLLTGESDQLLSAMKIKEETGEIFKFTAIPRAGEQGKGFAVVADEVRKLAEQSAGATDKISNILMDLQNEIQLAKESNDQQIDIIESSKSDMTEAKSSIEGLIESTEKSSTQIKQLSELVVILQQASHEENQVFSELYTRIQSNAANSQELLSMIDEVSTSVKHLNRLLESLANSTRKLENVF